MNCLRKLDVFTAAHKTLLRLATCTCDPSLAPDLLPVESLLPAEGGLAGLTQSLAKVQDLASVVQQLTPNPAKDPEWLVKAKTRLLAVVARFVGSPESLGEAGPFGFSPVFIEARNAKLAAQPAAAVSNKKVESHGVLNLKPEEVGKFIGKGAEGLASLGIPKHIKVHIEDDKARGEEARRAPKGRTSSDNEFSVAIKKVVLAVPAADFGIAKVKVTAHLPGKEKKRPTPALPSWDMEVDVNELRTELQKETDAVLALLVARANVISLETKTTKTDGKRKKNPVPLRGRGRSAKRFK